MHPSELVILMLLVHKCVATAFPISKKLSTLIVTKTVADLQSKDSLPTTVKHGNKHMEGAR
jgi:hypothetical protein